MDLCPGMAWLPQIGRDPLKTPSMVSLRPVYWHAHGAPVVRAPSEAKLCPGGRVLLPGAPQLAGRCLLHVLFVHKLQKTGPGTERASSLTPGSLRTARRSAGHSPDHAERWEGMGQTASGEVGQGRKSVPGGNTPVTNEGNCALQGMHSSW